MKESYNNYILFGCIILTSIFLTMVFFFHIRYKKTYSPFYYNANIVVMSYSYFLFFIMFITIIIGNKKEELPNHIIENLNKLKNGLKTIHSNNSSTNTSPVKVSSN